jgi:hypothetical protein
MLHDVSESQHLTFMTESDASTRHKHTKRRHPFESNEDALIASTMFVSPPHSWDQIAKSLPGRTARQCRERWLNYLSPTVRSSPWTETEDRLLIDKVNEHDFSWSFIARFFNGRSASDIKNRWYSHVKYETIQENNTFIFSAGAIARKKRNRIKSDPQQKAFRTVLRQFQAAAPMEANSSIITTSGTSAISPGGENASRPV